MKQELCHSRPRAFTSSGLYTVLAQMQHLGAAVTLAPIFDAVVAFAFGAGPEGAVAAAAAIDASFSFSAARTCAGVIDGGVESGGGATASVVDATIGTGVGTVEGADTEVGCKAGAGAAPPDVCLSMFKTDFDISLIRGS